MGSITKTSNGKTPGRKIQFVDRTDGGVLLPNTEHVPNVVEKERFSPGVGHGGRLRQVNTVP